MFDVVTSIKSINLQISSLTTEVASLNSALSTVTNGGDFQPTFNGPVKFDANSGNFIFDAGNGNGANYSTYNVKITLPTGTAFFGPDGTIKGYIDANYGYIDMKAGFRVNGVNVLTSKDFNPASYATLSGATFTNGITAPSVNVNGNLQAASATLGSVTSTGALIAASATISGAIAGTTLTLSQGLTATTAALSGTLAVTGATTLAGTSMSDAVVGNSGVGGLHLVTGDSAHTGYIEFTRPGTTARAGYLGYASTAGVITLAAEINGGYFDFISYNGAADPKVNGNTIWHSGNFTPSTSDLSAYLLKSGAVLTGAFDGGGYPFANIGTISTLNGTGTATLYSDTNTNDFVIRTGPSSGFFMTVFGADGSLRVPGALQVAAGGASITGATSIAGATTIVGDITTHRNSSAGAIFLGNSGSHYLYFDGSNYQMPAADLYVNGAKVYTTATINPSSFLVKGGTFHWSDTSTPVLQLAASSQAIGSSNSQGAGALTVVSADASSTSAYMSFLNANRYAVNFGLDAAGNLAVGGWSMGNNSYIVYHSGNFTGVMDIRLAYAGQVTGQSGDGVYHEPFVGGVVTGVAFVNANGSTLPGNLTYRYVQKQDIHGNWTTVGFDSPALPTT